MTANITLLQILITGFRGHSIQWEQVQPSQMWGITVNNMAAGKAQSSISSSCIAGRNVIPNGSYKFSGLPNSTETNSTTAERRVTLKTTWQPKKT